MKKKPKILIDAFHLYNALTGIKTYSILLFEALEKDKSLDNEYIIYPDWRKASSSKFLKGKLGLFKKLIHHAGFLLYKQLVLPIYALTRSADAIVSLDFVLPKAKMGKKSFVVIHDVFFWELRENYPESWRRYFTTMVQQGISKDTVLLSTSDYTSAKIRKFITNRQPIEVVYQSPKLLDSEGGDLSALKELEVTPGQYFFHVGLLDKRKNLLVLVEAFAQYIDHQPDSSMKLVLAGERGIGKAQDVYEEIKKLLRETKLEGRVLMPGFVSNELLGALYRNTYAYVFPSLDEGFGIPVLEAFHAEVPVIISDRGALKEIAGDAALMFESDNSSELCKVMLSLDESDLRNKLVEEGKKRLLNFSQGQFAKNFDHVINKYMNP